MGLVYPLLLLLLLLLTLPPPPPLPSQPSADERGKPVQITGVQRSGRGDGPGIRLSCILNLSDEAQITLQLTASLSDLV
jgi:hypothetical protein